MTESWGNWMEINARPGFFVAFWKGLQIQEFSWVKKMAKQLVSAGFIVSEISTLQSMSMWVTKSGWAKKLNPFCLVARDSPREINMDTKNDGLENVYISFSNMPINLGAKIESNPSPASYSTLLWIFQWILSQDRRSRHRSSHSNQSFGAPEENVRKMPWKEIIRSSKCEIETIKSAPLFTKVKMKSSWKKKRQFPKWTFFSHG